MADKWIWAPTGKWVENGRKWENGRENPFLTLFCHYPPFAGGGEIHFLGIFPSFGPEMGLYQVNGIAALFQISKSWWLGFLTFFLEPLLLLWSTLGKLA